MTPSYSASNQPQTMCNILKYRWTFKDNSVRLRCGCDYIFNLLKTSTVTCSYYRNSDIEFLLLISSIYWNNSRIKYVYWYSYLSTNLVISKIYQSWLLYLYSICICDAICENLSYGGANIIGCNQTPCVMRGTRSGSLIFVVNDHLQKNNLLLPVQFKP